MSWKSRAKWAGLVAAELCLASLAGWLAAPSADAPYLDLQARSDAVHRFVLVTEPLAALCFLLFAMLALVFAQFGLTRRVLHGVWLVALAFGVAAAAYAARFDLSLEKAGQRGQFIVNHPVPPLADAPLLGPFAEDNSGPGLASDELPGGRQLVLDRRSLFLRSGDGQVRWQRRRPGGWPAALLVAGETALLALPSDRYDDDVLLVALELEGGRLLFEFHALGRQVQAPQLQDGRILFYARRPGASSRYLIDAAGPQVVSAQQTPLAEGDGP